EREIGVGFRECRHAPGNVDARSDAVCAQIAGVGEAEPLLIEHSDANAPLPTSDDRFDGTLFDLDRPRLGFTEKYLASRAGRLERIERRIHRRVVGEPLAHRMNPAGGWHGGAGCARAVDRPRRSERPET